MSTVQWYPGHMTRAKRNIEADLKLCDVIIEILDARIPYSSENPDIRRITKGKNRVILLNKADLADPSVTEEWIRKLKDEGATAISMDGRSRDGLSAFRQAIRTISAEKRERDKKRGILEVRPVKAMVCGIPNVGKSTLVNTLTGHVMAKTGNKPGVTKGNQWIKAGQDLLLLDTPGVLWPRFEEKKVGYHLASIGSINDDILDKSEIAMFLSGRLLKSYRTLFLERYGFSEEELSEEKEKSPEIPGLDTEALSALNLIARKRNCVKKGAEPDYDRASKLFIDDFRSGRLGRISLERP